jgi:hypothetical protein
MFEPRSTLPLVHLEHYQSAFLIFQSTHVNRDAKRAVYEELILSICLYRCESWCRKETLYNELRQFHARCVRTMSRTNLYHTWIHHISTKNQEEDLGLDSMNNYIARQNSERIFPSPEALVDSSGRADAATAERGDDHRCKDISQPGQECQPTLLKRRASLG